MAISGVFEPPVDGVYLLGVYAISAQITNGHLFIKNNDNELCRAFVTGGYGPQTSTCSAIAELAVGDSVRVTGDGSDPAVIKAGTSGFFGHIIVE